MARWLKREGDLVAMDEPVVELETDKATLEAPAPVSGRLTRHLAGEGETLAIGADLASIEPMEVAASAPSSTPPSTAPVASVAPVAPSAPPPTSPAARREMAERGIDPRAARGAGPGGRIRKQDITDTAPSAPSGSSAPSAPPAAGASPAAGGVGGAGRGEERVRMSALRRTIARRLKEAQNTAAMLTTFNDVDMSEILRLRREHGEEFERRHGVRLGFMGFFVRACVAAMADLPAVNARIDGDELVYHRHSDIAIAVGGGKGLVTPVLRDAQSMDMPAIEAAVADFGRRARDGSLRLDELQGGTFTITNGGVYGSLMSTPILNPPQSAVLGIHRIEERPVARGGEVVVRPMTYLALTYDHRVVDGREAVTFLAQVKARLESPARLALSV